MLAAAVSCLWPGTPSSRRQTTTCLPVVPGLNTILNESDCMTGKECTFQYSSRPSPRMILQLAVGLLLFHNAGFLTQQTAFRLSTGSLTFALLSFIFLVVMLGRSAPHLSLCLHPSAATAA